MYLKENFRGMPSGGYVPQGGGEYASAQDVEPMFFHCMPVEFGRELLHCYGNFKRGIHLTGSDGWMALASIKTRTTCCVVCFSQYHADSLNEFVAHQTFRDTQSSDDALYCAPLVAAMG